jgi:hypothetical protein
MPREMELDGMPMSRFEAVKRMVARLIRGDNKDFTGRANDLIGIVSFSLYAETVSPLTNDIDVVSVHGRHGERTSEA